MKKSNIKQLYLFKADKVYYLGYGVTTEEGNKKYDEILPSTKCMQEDTLKALNRGGWVFSKFMPSGDDKNLFPVFNRVEGPSEVEAIDLGPLAKTNVALYQHLKNILVDKNNYKHDPSVTNKYQKIIHSLREENKPVVEEPKQEAKVEVQEQPSVQQRINQAPVQPQLDKISIKQETTQTTVKQETPQQQVVAVQEKSLRPITEVKGLDFLSLPIVLNKSDEFKEQLMKIKQGVYTRLDRSEMLADLGIKQITTKDEYYTFLTDFINDKIDIDNDPRAWLNLNYFVNPDVLHTDINKYHEDKLLHEFIDKKRNSFTIDNINKLREFFEKYPSPLLNDNSVSGYNNLLVALAKGYEGTESFQASVQYFIEEPIEGFNHVFESSKVILKPSIEIPSLEDPSDSNYIIDIQYVPKVNGKADFSTIKGEYEQIGEYPDYVSVKIKKPMPTLKFHAKMHKNLTVEISSIGAIKITNEVTQGSSQTNQRRIPKYFLIRSKVDSSVILPFPTKDGNFRGMSENDYITFNRIYTKINKTVELDLKETEFHVLDRIGFSALEVQKYLESECGKSGYAEISEVISDDINVEDYLLDYDDEHILEMSKTETAFGVNNSEYHKKMLLGLKHKVIMSTTASDFYRADMSKVKPTIIQNLTNMAIKYGFATPEEVYNELERVKETGEPITFNTPVTINWKVEPTAYNSFLERLEKEKLSERYERIEAKAKVVAIVTNYTETKELGIVMEISIDGKDKNGDNGTYVETFLRAKKIVRDGSLMFTNGYIMEDRFIPFNRNEEIPRLTIVESVQKQYKQLGYKGKFKKESFSFYFDEIYKPAIAEIISQGKDVSELVEPKTTYEIIFGNEQRSIDGSVPEAKEDLTEVKETTANETTTNETEVKEEETISNISDEMTTEQEPVKEVEQEQPKAVISEDIDEEDKPTDNKPIAQTEVKEESKKQTPQEGSSAPNNKEAQISIEIIATVHSEIETQKVIPYKDVIGVIGKVTKGTIQKNMKISLVDLYRHMVDGNVQCVNGQVYLDKIDLDKQVPSLTATNQNLKLVGSLGNAKLRTSIKSYEERLEQALEEHRQTGNELVMPKTPLEIYKGVKEKSQDNIDKIIHVSNQKQNYLGEAYKIAFKGKTKIVAIVGITNEHVYYYPIDRDATKCYQKTISEVINNESNLTKLGIVKLSNGMFIAEMANGKYTLLDETFKEI